MNLNTVENTIRQRLIETGKTLSESEISALAARIVKAGDIKMAAIGETAIHAEKNGVNYSPSAHLKAIGS